MSAYTRSRLARDFSGARFSISNGSRIDLMLSRKAATAGVLIDGQASTVAAICSYALAIMGHSENAAA